MNLEKNDNIGEWAKDALEFKKDMKTPLKIVYEAYMSYCEKEGMNNESIEIFGKRMRKLYEIKKCRDNDIYDNCRRIINYRIKSVAGVAGSTPNSL